MDGPRRIDVGGAVLEAVVLGSGEPVVVIGTGLDADELLPLAQRLARSGRHRVVHYHRRGYAGSGPARGEPSIAADAADAAALMAALDVTPAHVVGASLSAAVALTLASWAPGAVRTLTVIEPPPVGVPGVDAEFRAANVRLLATSRSAGPAAAVEELMTMLAGAGWRQASERTRPGAAAATEAGAAAFFGRDVPALLSWRFGAEEAGTVTCPVLHVGGSESGAWFEAVRDHVLRLLPHAEDRTVTGAGHLLALTHPAETADLVTAFLRRHAARAGQ